MEPSHKPKSESLSCPSAPAISDDAEVFGIVGGTAEAPVVRYLPQPFPLTQEMLQALGSVRPGEVLRARGRCAKERCVHFANDHCSLGDRIAAQPREGSSQLPPCAIRATCRWFAEQGKEACLRCPSIVTERIAPVERLDPRIHLPVLR